MANLSASASRHLEAAMANVGAAKEIKTILNGVDLLATPGAALTAQLTTITPADAEGTPDYAIAALTSTTPFGFASAQEGITILYVIKNLQVRLAEVEARLEAAGVVTAN